MVNLSIHGFRAKSPRLLPTALIAAFAWLSLCVPASATVNNEGVSGLLSTPTAEVVNDGDAVFSVSRSYDDTLDPAQDWAVRNYCATVGYLPRLEITARFADFPGRPDPNYATNYQDRSVAVKYQLLNKDNFTLAAGMTDIGGYSKANKSMYGVIDYTGIPTLRLSAGVGNERLDGAFGGLRWTPVEYVSLVGEYDTRNTNYGIEVHPNPRITLRAGVVADHPSYTASYRFPLDPRGKDTRFCPACITPAGCTYADPCEMAAAVRDALVAESYENVLVGAGEGTLFVEYECRRFQNQVDALGVAAAIALRLSSPEVERLVLTPKLEDIPQLSLQAPRDALAAYLCDPCAPASGFCVTEYLAGGCPSGVVYADEGNKKPGGGDVYLRFIEAFEITRPHGPTFASMNGLGLEENVYLGRGLKLRARQDWPIHNDLYEKTDPFNRDAQLMYLDNWAPGLFVLGSAGYYGDEQFGGTAEAKYQIPETTLNLGARSAMLKHEGGFREGDEDTQLLGTASYYVPELDWELTALSGQFLNGDSGHQVESTRTFGPTSITYFAYDSDANRANGGFRLNFAMPWFSEGKHGDWRATGSRDFQYQYRTDGSPHGKVLLPEYNLSQVRGQLRPEYIREHLADLRRSAVIHGQACSCQ